jgi:hypothetical protein
MPNAIAAQHFLTRGKRADGKILTKENTKIGLCAFFNKRALVKKLVKILSSC